MKILTLNFLTCAVRNCKSSPAAFPLHVRDAELEIVELEFQPEFLRNVLPRLDMDAIKSVANELGLQVPALGEHAKPDENNDVEMRDEVAAVDVESEQPVAGQEDGAPAAIQDEDLKSLHRILLETQIDTGMLVCGNCGHEYKILEGIPNFLLPPHLV